MTASTRLERELTDWLSETAMPQMPDYADDILAETSRIHQRPRWTFVGRWLPIANLGRFAPVGSRTALRAVALLVVLTLLLAAIVAFVGSRLSVPVPPPFGQAGNGLIAYEQAGAIWLVDPDTLASHQIVGFAGNHHDPQWSLDGRRVAFVRESSGGQVLVMADDTGRILTVSEPFSNVDSDSLEWSPDGRHIAITATLRTGRALALVDTRDGKLRNLGLDFEGLEIFWRPPDGLHLLFRTTGGEGGLRVVSLVDGSVTPVPPKVVDRDTLRPLGWTPDGQAILYQQRERSDRAWTYVADVKTGDERRLDVAWGHVSNDGTRVAGLDASDRPCIVAITGGVCRPIADAPTWLGSTGAAVVWSPDDRWLLIFKDDGRSIVLVDVTGAVPPREILSSGPASWQRIVP